MSEDTGATLVAAALAEAVNRAGPSLSSEPRRVQGMISDSLGSDGRTRRIELEAVVLAAEERIPDELMAGHLEPAGAVEILRSRGLDADSAQFSVDVWRYALGQMGADAEPPTLTKSVDPSTDGTSDGLSDHADMTIAPSVLGFDWDDQLRADEPELINRQNGSEGPETSGHGADPVPTVPNAPAKSRRGMILVSTGVALALVVGVAAILLLRGGNTDVAAGPEKTSKPESLATTFTAEPGRLWNLKRDWSIHDETLTATLKFRNETTQEVKGVHYEVIPKEVAKSASDIKSRTPFKVVKNDPVISWDVTIPAKKSLTISYAVKVSATSSAKDLRTWKAAQIEAAKAFATERAAKPSLKITSPNNPTILTGSTTITGTADPNSKVTVAGVAVKVGADGTWSRQLDGLTPGPHSVEVAVTSQFGVVNKALVTVTVTPPTTTPAAPTTTAAPSPKTQSKAQPVPDAPTPVPPRSATTTIPRPKPISVSISGPSTWYIPPDSSLACNYDLTMHPVGFTPRTIRWSGGSYYNDKTTARFNTSGLQPGSASVTVTATAPDGRSVSASFSITLVLGTPHSC